MFHIRMTLWLCSVKVFVSYIDRCVYSIYWFGSFMLGSLLLGIIAIFCQPCRTNLRESWYLASLKIHMDVFEGK
jgi:hypothetical protein